MAPCSGACGRGCAPVPKPVWGRGLSERSEFRSPNSRDWGKGTRMATPGRPWFWVLLPKQKDLGVRGRHPARPSHPLSFPQVFSGNPGSLCSCRGGHLMPPAETAKKRTAPWDGAATKTTAVNGRRHEMRSTEGGMRCRHYRGGAGASLKLPDPAHFHEVALEVV